MGEGGGWVGGWVGGGASLWVIVSAVMMPAPAHRLDHCPQILHASVAMALEAVTDLRIKLKVRPWVLLYAACV